MKRLSVIAVMLGAATTPAVCQTVQAPTMGAMAATDVGIEPMMRIAGPLYARLALANEMRTIEAARLAVAGADKDATRAMARAMLQEHLGALRAISAIPAAAMQLHQAKVWAVRDVAGMRNNAARGFAEVQLDWQRHAWALHSGYAADGQDPALRDFARSAVMRTEGDLRRLPMRPMKY
jgi:putative membrane protein